MDIVRLIVSIIFPPVGLLINIIVGAETKLQKAAMMISNTLCILIIVGIVGIIVLIGGSNGYEDDLYHCQTAYKCDYSDGEYQTCYYYKDKNHKRTGKVQCVNDSDDRFNYGTVAKDSEDEE